MWDTAKTNAPVKSINLESLVGYSVEWSKNEEYLFVTATGGKIFAFDSKNFNLVKKDIFMDKADLKVQSCAANWKTLPGRVFCSSDEGHIVWYLMKNQELIKESEFVAHIDGCRSVNLHPHQKFLLSTGRDGSARLWDCNEEGKPKIRSNLAYHK